MMWKCSTSISCWDLNPSPSTTTRPRLPPQPWDFFTRQIGYDYNYSTLTFHYEIGCRRLMSTDMENFSSRRWTTIQDPYWINLRNSALTAETNIVTFMDWADYWWGRYGCSSPSTKVLHATYRVTTTGITFLRFTTRFASRHVDRFPVRLECDPSVSGTRIQFERNKFWNQNSLFLNAPFPASFLYFRLFNAVENR